MKRTPLPRSRKPIKPGRKMKADVKNRRELKQLFEQQYSITWCEMCGSRFGLSFAHSKKRRHIAGDELKEVALLCISPCHEEIERLPEAEMTAKIQEIIALRGLAQ